MSCKKVNVAGSRSRAPNFTREEQEILSKVMEPYSHIIESKKTDSIKQSEKQKTWTKITEIYNANTTQCPRTTENLISCYRNIKTRLKKERSEAKMFLKDPVQKETFVIALEESGNDLSAVSKQSNVPIEICQIGLEELKNEIKKSDADHKKKIMGTGGGPPEPYDDPMIRIKKIIEPQIDGLFTLYDGDSELMKLYQETLPENERRCAIESDFIEKNELQLVSEDKPTPQETVISTVDSDRCALLETPQGSKHNRGDILKKKLHPALDFGKSHQTPSSKKKNANASFVRLAEEKLLLVGLNQKVAIEELKEKKMNVELKEFELTHKKKILEMELQNIIKENAHKDEIRKRELAIMDLKINQLQNKFDLT